MTDTNTRRADLLRQLFAVGNTLGMPDPATQAWRSQRMADLQREIDCLPKAERPPIGAEAGTLFVGSLLGDRPTVPPLDETDATDGDPFLRGCLEMGEDPR